MQNVNGKNENTMQYSAMSVRFGEYIGFRGNTYINERKKEGEGSIGITYGDELERKRKKKTGEYKKNDACISVISLLLSM